MFKPGLFAKIDDKTTIEEFELQCIHLSAIIPQDRIARAIGHTFDQVLRKENKNDN